MYLYKNKINRISIKGRHLVDRENDIPEMIKELNNFESKWWNRVGDDKLYDGIDDAIRRIEELKKGNY